LNKAVNINSIPNLLGAQLIPPMLMRDFQPA